MAQKVEICNDPEAYGSKGQAWNSNFVSYMVEIVTHPGFADMPDAVKKDGKIQWEAPSNRRSGQYQHTYHRRLDWWRKKARAIGVDPSTDQWISRVAKKIHPTGMKPCKRCGRVMRIAYVYPNGYMQRRLEKAFGGSINFDALESITDLIQRVADQYGVDELAKFRRILEMRDFSPPTFLNNVDAWISWLEDHYIPREPSLLSPGAMSNAPDRFDGFHSFNLCCRKKADTGRHDTNMRIYTTDRRVFEYWSDGDWIAADRMMGLISARMRTEPSADGGDGPPTADHIGPLSLGFAHRPNFRLLSRSANSAKNNRMTLDDVRDLMAYESLGIEVASWYAKPLWDLRKRDASTEELALRLSKVLRDNQRAAMHMLVKVFCAGHLTFLSSLLGLERANYNIEFENLRVENFVVTCDSVNYTDRLTRYASEQKARRLRIGFEALRAYGGKENRHALNVPVITTPNFLNHLKKGLTTLKGAENKLSRLDDELCSALAESDAESGEQRLRRLSASIPLLSDEDVFVKAKAHLTQAMTSVAEGLSEMWESNRYVRSTFEEIDSE